MKISCNACRNAKSRGKENVYCLLYGIPIHKDFRKEECFRPMIMVEEKNDQDKRSERIKTA